MATVSPTKMTTDPNPDNWSRWFAVGTFLGGIISAIGAKIHWGARGASRERFNGLMDRMEQIERDAERDRRRNDSQYLDILRELREIRARRG